MFRKIVLAVGISAAALVGFGMLVLVAAQRATPPVPLGIRDGRLAPCPPTPNCVSSQSDDPQHAIAPLPFPGDRDAARAALRQVLANQPRMTILRDESDYMHVLFRSPTLGFPDDVEFLFDAAAPQIHVRAAARMGHDDLGVNRARIESIRAALALHTS